MPRVFAALVLALAILPARSADPEPKPAIEAGLKFLTDEAVSWKSERKCASCHHVPMTLWALGEAKQRGYAVSDKAIKELTSWVLGKDDPAKINPKQKEQKDIFANPAPLLVAIGVGSLQSKEHTDGIKAMLDLVVAGQDKDGAWRLMYVWEPINSTPDAITTLALLALHNSEAGDATAAKMAYPKGIAWLEKNAGSSTQSIALRLALLKRVGRLGKEWEPLADELLGRQRNDGGWGQTKEEPSDAYATGQVLYALAEAGRAKDATKIKKGVDFLLKSQEEDGSWEMKSRPGQPQNRAAKELGPISHAGTAWAVIGLVKATPRP